MKCNTCANRNLCKDICSETICLGIYNFKLDNMKTYVGTKTVKARPCTLGEFIKLTGRNPYANDGKMHGGNEEGYLVEYKDGYESWSPKDVFEEAYKCAESFMDRLVIEQKDLAEKLEKLCLFIDSPKFTDTVKDKIQQELLIKQRDYMGEYLNILNQRIKLLK